MWTLSVSMANDPESITWTPGGVWLKTVDWDGKVRTSFMGQRSLERIKHFCEMNGIRLYVHHAVGEPKSPARTGTGASRVKRV